MGLATSEDALMIVKELSDLTLDAWAQAPLGKVPATDAADHIAIFAQVAVVRAIQEQTAVLSEINDSLKKLAHQYYNNTKNWTG